MFLGPGHRKDKIAMELQRKQWFVHWFFVSLAIITRFSDGYMWYDERRYKDGTNLCHFMRVIFMWAPLVVLLNLTAYVLVLCALIVTPIYMFGVSAYLAIILGLGASVALIIGASIVLMLLGEHARDVEKRRRAARFAKSEQEEGSTAKVEPPKGPKFSAVVWQYAVAIKHRFCPTLTFKTQEMSSLA